ncbi:hypothetical protein [Flagellimonas onchidii]|uniref:hypothetical protein n=1 Tax=Flagellimonas onchidii TaxID=2562684 RepID=UPI0010A5BA4D|nr:hypothetical protein [Allomuricauda onchidii]
MRDLLYLVIPLFILYTRSMDAISYFLCMNEEASLLFSESVQSLIDSKCFDYMVYRVVKDNGKYDADMNVWSIKVEINEGLYLRLHYNLCRKLREFVRLPINRSVEN